MADASEVIGLVPPKHIFIENNADDSTPLQSNRAVPRLPNTRRKLGISPKVTRYRSAIAPNRSLRLKKGPFVLLSHLQSKAPGDINWLVICLPGIASSQTPRRADHDFPTVLPLSSSIRAVNVRNPRATFITLWNESPL